MHGIARVGRSFFLACLASALTAEPADAQPATQPAHPAIASASPGPPAISPDFLAKFAPPPLPPAFARTLQSLTDVRAPGAGMISSDGRRLFFDWDVTGANQVWRLDGPQGFPVQMTGGQDPTELAAVAPDGSFLVVARDRGGEEYPGLYWQSSNGGPLKLIQHLPRVQTLFAFVSDDSHYVYFRANDIKPDSYAIYRWDRQTERKETVFAQDGSWQVLDRRADGQLLLSKELGSAVNEIYDYDPADKRLTAIIGQGERNEYVARYGHAPGEILVLTNKLGEFRRLYRWRSGQLAGLSPPIEHDVSDFNIDRSRLRILYNVNDGGYTRLFGLDARTGKPLRLPRLPASDHASVEGFSSDGRFAVVSVDPGDAPRTSYVLDWRTGKLTNWQRPSAPEVDLTRFVRAQLESYPARDGTRIPMLVRRPRDCRAPCPVVVDFHGGPEDQARPGFVPFVQAVLDLGMVFVQPNVRGSDGYGKAWFHADDGPRRLGILTDIEDCARFIRKEWAVGGKAPKIGISGTSYGGYSALMGMSMFAGAYDVGVAGMAVSNLQTFLANTPAYRRANRIQEWGDPVRDRAALEKLSPITYVDRIKGPLLIIGAGNDARVPLGEVLQMHDAIEARGIKSPLMIFGDQGHNVTTTAGQIQVLGNMLLFLKQHLNPDS
jgi:dipeptidyl aminopeptidase/acylaminoacyl peptidase